MKLVMDERFKHRIVGVLVLTSVAVLFAPIILKKPHQSSELNHRVVIKLPPKPALPKVEVPEAQALLKTTQLSPSSLPRVEDKLPTEAQISKAEPLNTAIKSNDAPMAVKNLVLSANHGVEKGDAKSKYVAKPSIRKNITTSALVKKANPKVQAANHYSVQLAVFSQQKNANNLIKVLKTKGFTAFVKSDKLSNKDVFRVLVASTGERQAAQELQHRLASAVQIKGFVVPVVTRTS